MRYIVYKSKKRWSKNIKYNLMMQIEAFSSFKSIYNIIESWKGLKVENVLFDKLFNSSRRLDINSIKV